MSERSYRIRTDVTKDKVVRLKVEQDYDFLEILSLKIKQEDAYKLHVANYGVIVGRVLANDAFGIPNAKVSVFIELEDDDKLRSEITNIYPYTSFQTKDSEGRRYNLLPDESNDDCYRVVGTFPNKRLVLDDETYLEVFDKYWKYTTVTNKSGDYMIFGVPKGGHQIHVDIDLSDIGILSQKPIDFMYKGYNATQFDNAQQFKESNNLDNLTQLLSQNQSVHVYPFWGDENLEDIAISRCDIQVQYKFEPTCVFFGAIMTDNYNNNIGHKCSASKYAGFNRHLVTGEGTIEMIRKTPDNLVEEFQIQGNRLIDGDGVWCYQIPMNLDFIGTDEFGNIIPTDDPNKGVPTRTCVRFRVSMQETGNEGVSRHRAKYLIPNVQDVIEDETQPRIKNSKNFEQCYEFGSATIDEYFRDLYWNKVYSVKNYIPRIQTNGKKNTQNYSAIRTVNSNNDVNPVPFNHARFRLAFGYRVLCMIMTIVFMIICIINAFFAALACFCLPKLPLIGRICPFKALAPACIGVSGGLTEDEDANIEYFPCCRQCGKMNCSEKGCTKETSYDALLNVVQQSLSQEYDTVNLDFYNDWLNGSLYMPLWFWKKTKKKKFLFGLFSKKAVNSFCSCSKNFPKLRVTESCSLEYNNSYLYTKGDKGKKYHEYFPEKSNLFTIFGVIKEHENKAGLNIYYYAPGIPNDTRYKQIGEEDSVSYIRLYSTDIILLGSLNSCDLDNYPNVYVNLPTTTANVPFIATIKQATEQEDGATYMEGTSEEKGYIEVTGMDWLHEPQDSEPKYGAGLFMDLACNAVYTKPKTCVNLARMCELGVSLDTYMEDTVSRNNMLTYNTILADGMITRYELVDNETRAMFASLNNNGFKEKIFNPNTGYNTYKLRYVYPIDFDGHMAQAENYTSMMDFKTYDKQDPSYVEYRLGLVKSNSKIHFYTSKGEFPLFNNSFYFYFGIHEGSTAIDKFNSRFYATCYKNEKYPFTMIVETHSAKWCALNDTDYATIDITLNGIKTPYSYTLKNVFNEILIEEDGINITDLKFGYDIVEGGGAYEIDENEDKITYVKNGTIKYFLTGEEVRDSYNNTIKLTNNTYKLEITDVNGNVGVQTIIIEQVPINISYEVETLGNKYYENISKATDFCNENELYGEIKIMSFLIDGIDYYITQNGITPYGNSGVYDCTVVNNNNEPPSKVRLTIEPQNETYTFNECSCGFNKPNIPMLDYKILENTETEKYYIMFPIWIPDTYKITINQWCNNSLNDNITTVMVDVKNGEPFNAYLNDVPFKFILGNNEDVNIYNENFNSRVNNINNLKGWFKLHDENTYVFDRFKTVIDYKNVWSDFIKVSTEKNEENENDNNDYLSEETLFDILEYKFKSMFNLSKGAYVIDDGTSSFELGHTGGKTPILYRGNYPDYSEFTGDENEKNQFESYIFDSDGYASVDYNYPNIIGDNYTYIHEDSEMNTLYKLNDYPSFNPAYKDYKKGYLGNYFAVFTRNGAIVKKENEECGIDNSIKYQQIPFKSDPIHEICVDESETENEIKSEVYTSNNTIKPYLRAEFIDRRLDYDFLIFTPYANDDIVAITSNDTNAWKNGRISGNTFNGVEMIYNNTTDYQIIGEGLEYTYTTNYLNNTGNSTTRYYSDVTKKRYYKANLKCGNKKYDILEAFWAGNNNNELRRPNEEKFSILSYGGYATDNKIFSYDSSDLVGKCYNGDFGIDNYPTKRLLDLANIPTCDKLTFELSSCSYNIELGYEDVSEVEEENIDKTNGSITLTGATEEIGAIDFSIDCRNMINPQLPSLEECAATNSYNVSYEYEDNMFVSKRFNLKCKLKQDTVNTTHQIYTEFPNLICVKKKDGKENYIEKVKCAFSDKNSNETIGHIIFEEILKDKNGCDKKEFDVDSSTVKDIKDTRSSKNIGVFKNIRTGHYWVLSSDDDIIAYDDNVNVKNVVYTTSEKLNNYDVIGTYIKRNYVNNSGDNLTKSIQTIQFTSIYDVRPFEVTCPICKVVSARTTSVESELDINVDVTVTGSVPTSSSEAATDKDGNITGVTTTTGSTDVESSGGGGNSASSTSGENANTVENTSAATWTQQTIFNIKSSANDTTRNLQFIDYESISASFMVKKDGRKITSDVIVELGKGHNYNPEDNSGDISIDFNIMWSGDLQGIYITDETTTKMNLNSESNYDVALFINMPNKLIYRLEFNISSGGVLNS